MSLDFGNPSTPQLISNKGILQNYGVPTSNVPSIDFSFVTAPSGLAPDLIQPDKALEEQKALQLQQIELQKQQMAQSQESANRALELSYYQYAQSVQQGNKKSGKVICTRIHELGLMPDDIFRVDQLYGELLADQHPDFMDWYHEKAQWFLDRMHNKTLASKLFIRLSLIFVNPWSRQMAYIMGYLNRGKDRKSVV